MARVLKNSKVNPSTGWVESGEAEARSAARQHANALALEGASDGSEFADREAGKAALRKGLKS
jgi:hypothetical protein